MKQKHVIKIKTEMSLLLPVFQLQLYFKSRTELFLSLLFESLQLIESLIFEQTSQCIRKQL